jgi:ADP-ribose pyrophosphatase YjhB (NUDIX family)
MRAVTLCLLRRGAGDAAEVCLGWKKIGFGAGKWAGIGGKVDVTAGETVADAARRELREEILVDAEDLIKVAVLTFSFKHEPTLNMQAHVYLVWDWRGRPSETAEMRPCWFTLDAVPYDGMWDDAKHWLPRVLAGERLCAHFTYSDEHALEGVTIKPLPPGKLRNEPKHAQVGPTASTGRVNAAGAGCSERSLTILP